MSLEPGGVCGLARGVKISDPNGRLSESANEKMFDKIVAHVDTYVAFLPFSFSICRHNFPLISLHTVSSAKFTQGRYSTKKRGKIDTEVTLWYHGIQKIFCI